MRRTGKLNRAIFKQFGQICGRRASFDIGTQGEDDLFNFRFSGLFQKEIDVEIFAVFAVKRGEFAAEHQIFAPVTAAAFDGEELRDIFDDAQS